jgi:DNA-binding XRE family transcriptional regulator/predicted membrane protein
MEHTLGKRIMQHRKRCGLTQDQLAEKLGITAQAVSKWENDQSCPDITMLPRLAELFGTTTDALLGHSATVHSEPEENNQNSGWEFHWDGGSWSAISTAVFVLLVGALLLAARYFHWDVGFWGITWPSAILVYGLFSLPKHPHVTNVVCTLIGGYFLVNNLGIIEISLDKSLIFPVLILVCGISLLLDALQKPKKSWFSIKKNGTLDHKKKTQFTQNGEGFDCKLSFGEAEHRITLPRLSHGSANVSFGELEIDLTGCGTIVDGCTLDLNASFASLELRVPSEYRVEYDTSSFFGSVSVSGQPDAIISGTIRLDGNISFGELEICYE